jgi:transcriptional regulator with XRE-family HTH domain
VFDLESEEDLNEEERNASRRMADEEAAFAERLLTVMAEKSMSQVQLAAAVGVGQPAISMMLSRNCRPQRRTVEKLARALEVSPETLWPDLADQPEAAEIDAVPTRSADAALPDIVGQATAMPYRPSGLSWSITMTDVKTERGVPPHPGGLNPPAAA